MDNRMIDEYLNALFFLSNGNTASGCPIMQLAQLLELDQVKLNGLLDYLRDEDLIARHPSFPGHIVLTGNGIRQVEKYRAGKLFKVIKFKRSYQIPRGPQEAQGFLFSYIVIYEDGRQENKMFGVFVTDLLCMRWGLRFEAEDARNVEKILLQFALKTIIARLEEGYLGAREELVLQAQTQPGNCPYKPANLIDVDKAAYEIFIPPAVNGLPVAQYGHEQDNNGESGRKRRVFFHYSHHNDKEYLDWVARLAKRISEFYVKVIYDQENLNTMDNAIHFMDDHIKNSDKVVMIFTPEYKTKVDAGKTGVAYEYALILRELYKTMPNNEKYIPVLLSGTEELSVPPYMQQFIAVDMRSKERFEEGLQEIIAAIFNTCA